MTVTSLPVSAEALNRILNVSTEEVSALYDQGDDGTMVAKAQTEIDNFVLNKFKIRVDKLVADGSAESSKTAAQAAAQAARLEIYKDIETEAKSLGVEMRYTEDKLSKLRDHLVKVDPAKTVDVKQAPEFREMVLSFEKKLSDIEESKQQEIGKIRGETTKSNYKNYLRDLFSKEENKIAVPDNLEAFDYRLNQVIESGLHEKNDVKLDWKDGKPILLDSNGNVKNTDDGSYQSIDPDSYFLNLGKSTVFDEIRSPKIDSPNPLGKGQVKVLKEGKETVVNLPKFASIEQGMKWVNEYEKTENYSMDVIRAANEQMDALAQ